MATTLIAEDLHFRRRERVILDGVELSLGEGELVSLLGANGAGKTTLLSLLLGFARPHAGRVTLNGAPLPTLGARRIARAIAYVPQSHVAPFPYTVRDVARLGRIAANGMFTSTSSDDERLVCDILRRLRIDHLADRPYTAISGGERQLAMIARALVQGARLLIMDEPLTGLDFGNQLRLLDLLRDLAADGFGILMTSHHPDLVADVSNRVLLLLDGRIADDGPPEVVMTDQAMTRLYGVPVEADRIRFRMRPAAQ